MDWQDLSGSAEPKPWTGLIRDDPRWQLEAGALVHRDAPDRPPPPSGRTAGMKEWVVRYVYAAQNRSRVVRSAIAELVGGLTEAQWGLNFGAGSTRFHSQILNLDICHGPRSDIVNAGDELPFRDDALDLVISQEVLEHLEDPVLWIQEIHRVLKPNGKFYCQLPFIIGYHPGPADYWRFTKEAYPRLLPDDRWEIERLELSVGHGSGLYRILVEFTAVTASAIHSKLYMPAKGIAALLWAPLRLFDLLTRFSDQRDRIPGGYFCVARKR